LEARAWGKPLLAAAAVVLILVPLLNCSIFVGSFWDPYGNLCHLPVALVNLDAGCQFQGQRYELGRELRATLESQRPLGFTDYQSEELARKALDRGEVYAILVLPPDLSVKAISGEDSARASLKLITAEGRNYFASRVSESAAKVITNSLNERLGTERWSAVTKLVPEVSAGFSGIHGALDQLTAGAAQLASGSAELATGSKSLAGGIGQAQAGSAQLANGAATLSSGETQLASASGDLAAGSAALAAGAQRFQESVGKNGLAPTALKSASRELAAGSGKLATGAQALSSGLESAQAGAGQLASGAVNLSKGLTDLDAGAEKITSGADALAAGNARLAQGLETLSGKIPSGVDVALGTPEKLASSIELRESRVAAVENNGTAFAPYFMGINLWIGVIMGTFLFAYGSLPLSAQGLGQGRKLAVKFAIPLLFSACQALAMAVGIQALGVHVAHPAHAFAAALVSSWCFLFIVGAFIELFGDAGKLLSVIVLILQAATAGGSFPVELMAPFFRVCNGLLPMSATLTALRYGISDALPPLFWSSIARLGISALVGVGLLLLARTRWTYLPDSAYSSLCLKLGQKTKAPSLPKAGAADTV
jgi:putative membrane protein